ncbi:hypothetical protein BC835DRAFT_1412889 [Cytidiella melzeri]|nr:hypothetical protein BC835DRAFT_1412889 [Cytidiella melzeri]
MPARRLNFDIIRIVIDYAYHGENTVALVSCAQVCRQWHIASRRFIFRNVRLSTGTLLTEFETLLIADPDIGMLVQTLHIQPRVTGTFPTAASWVAAIPRVLPAKLNRLKHIELVHLCENGTYCNTRFFRACDAFSSVDRLTIRDSTLGLNLLYAFASSLPSLKHLSVGFIVPPIASAYPYPEQLLDPRFSTLTLDIGQLYPLGLPSILGWLAKSTARQTLRSLDIHVHAEQVSDLGMFLQRHGALLEDLSLTITPALAAGLLVEYEAPAISLDITSCTSLQTLTLFNLDPAFVNDGGIFFTPTRAQTGHYVYRRPEDDS